MGPSRWRLLPLFFVGFGLLVTRAEEVEVSLVRFAAVRAPNGASEPWLGTEVVLNVMPPPSAPGRVVSRVRVALWVGWELLEPVGGAARVEYYRAEAECVALDSGRADVRFYLPPELVKRDRLHGAPKFWTVELAVAGRALPPSRSASSAPLAADPAARRAFLATAAAAAPVNDGLLQPQYLTPFALEYPRATPSFVRRERASNPSAPTAP